MRWALRFRVTHAPGASLQGGGASCAAAVCAPTPPLGRSCGLGPPPTSSAAPRPVGGPVPRPWSGVSYRLRSRSSAGRQSTAAFCVAACILPTQAGRRADGSPCGPLRSPHRHAARLRACPGDSFARVEVRRLVAGSGGAASLDPRRRQPRTPFEMGGLQRGHGGRRLAACCPWPPASLGRLAKGPGRRLAAKRAERRPAETAERTKRGKRQRAIARTGNVG
jgi:hypothetical protein